MRVNKKYGQGIVEMALALPIFLLMIMGVFDFGRALHCWTNLNFQCIQAARAGSIRKNQLIAPNLFLSTTHAPKSEIVDVFWQFKSPIMDKKDFNIAIDPVNNDPEINGVGLNRREVEVKATYDLTLITPFMYALVGGENKEGAVTLSASAVERKE